MSIRKLDKFKVCDNCGAWFQKLYQYSLCKRCLIKDFNRLRPMIDNVIGTRYISNPDESSTTISAVLPDGRELFLHDTLELVEPVEVTSTKTPPFSKGGIIIPWMQFDRKRYLSSTYPKRYEI